MVRSCPRLSDVFSNAAKQHPCSPESPWSLIVAFDEFCTGNPLRVNNKRKAMVRSFSFIELGREALWHEAWWLTPILVRHSVVMQAAGGWSAMLRTYLHQHLLAAAGISTAGVPLELSGQPQPLLLFAKINTSASRWGWAAPGLRVERSCWLKAVCATLEHFEARIRPRPPSTRPRRRRSSVR